MDMKCNKCGESWDWFYIRDEVLLDQPLYKKMEKRGGYVCDNGGLGQSYEVGSPAILVTSRSAILMRKEQKEAKSNWQFVPGPMIAQCPACIGKEIIQDDNSKIRAELAALYGDDIDGFMADMEDFGL